MVGHTGVLEAAICAVETVDECLGRVVDAFREAAPEGALLVLSDHGNCEQMVEPDGSPHTAHTTNPVPLIVTDHAARLREGGELKDLMPTALAYLGLTKPLQVTGQKLCK